MKKFLKFLIILTPILICQCSGPYQYQRKGKICQSTRIYSSFSAKLYKYARDEASSKVIYYPKYYCSFDEPNLLLSIKQNKITSEEYTNNKENNIKSVFTDPLNKNDNHYSLSVDLTLNDNKITPNIIDLYSMRKMTNDNIDLEAELKFDNFNIDNYSIDFFTGDLNTTNMDFYIQSDKNEANGKELIIISDVKKETELEEGDICQIRFVSSTFSE